MGDRIFGLIGVLWGGGLLLSFFLGTNPIEDSDAYDAGQITGLIFGGVLFVVGLYYLVRGSQR